MKFSIATLLMLLLANAAFSQTKDVVINRHGGKGKKNGYYIQYLDKNLNPIDSANSYFYGYEYYDANSPLFKFVKNKKVNTVVYPDSIQISRITKGHPILLTGFFRLLNQNILIAEYYFDTAGIVKYSKYYHAQYGKSKDIMKYGLEESFYNNIKEGFIYEYFVIEISGDRENKVLKEKSLYTKENGKWSFKRIENPSDK
jgi:hypothetical protein